jgi:hypothetical protein
LFKVVQPLDFEQSSEETLETSDQTHQFVEELQGVQVKGLEGAEQ